MTKGLQVWDVDGRADFLCEVVCDDAGVLELPAEDISNDQDTGLAIAGDVGVEAGDLAVLALRFAVPLESGFAALRHVVDVLVDWSKELVL